MSDIVEEHSYIIEHVPTFYSNKLKDMHKAADELVYKLTIDSKEAEQTLARIQQKLEDILALQEQINYHV